MEASVTAKPYFRPMGYLVIKPVSPASLLAVGPGTTGGYIEGMGYLPAPTGVLVREEKQTTG